jgi:FtsP/CotA-like multicopper oxidase with cupredoxin domain
MTLRATFLHRGGATLTALALRPMPAAAAASDVIDIKLQAQAVIYRPAPGVEVRGVAYNRTIPGPLLRVVHGQRVRVQYLNNCGEPTSVHWHGMVLPNAMDGAAGITQAAVPDGGTFEYAFAPNPPGTRWYHDHADGTASMRGLFGMFIVDDPEDAKADAEFAVVFHDVPAAGSPEAAMAGHSNAPMLDPLDSAEMAAMHPGDLMGDEIAYVAHCVNGATYPNAQPLVVKVGQRVRLRILNANQTQTRYVRLAGHRLTVTHLDGNPLAEPVTCDALRLGVAERCDAWFEVRNPGAWLLQTITSAPLAFEQAVVVHTPDHANASPRSSSSLLGDAEVLTYECAGGGFTGAFSAPHVDVAKTFELEGGDYGGERWTMNDKSWPDTERVLVRHGDDVLIRFRNTTDMDHPMHLHGHTFDIVELNGRALRLPIPKDVSLVPANGGTMTWRFRADSPPGRWLLHCHNQIHMMDGMMTELDYR